MSDLVEQNVPYAVYDSRTGAVIRIGTCPVDWVSAQARPESFEAVDVGAHTFDEWFDGEWKPLSDIEPIVSGGVVGGLPVPCTAYVDGERYEIDDGIAEFSFSPPGAYMVRLEAVGHRTKTIEVTA